LLTATFQLIWSGYLTNVAFDAAIEGATIASASNGTLTNGELRARRALAALGGFADAEISGSSGSVGERSVSQMNVTVHSALLGFGLIEISQTAEALDEVRS